MIKNMALLLLLLAGFLAGPAGAQEFEMAFRDLKSAGIDVYVRGQYLTAIEESAALKGVPFHGKGRSWYLEAKLGDGENNTFPIMAFQPDGSDVPMLVMDCDRNGDLSNEKLVAMEKERSGEGYTQYESPPLDFFITVGHKEVPYRASLGCNLYEEREPYFRLVSRCCRKGWILLGEEKYWAVLIDDNTNGLFNEAAWSTDKLIVDKVLEGNIYDALWNQSVRVVIKDGRWYLFKPEPDGSILRGRGVEENLARLKTNFNNFSLQLQSSKTGALNLEAKNGAIELPPGEYQWLLYNIPHFFENGEFWRLSSGTIMNKPFSVKEGENLIELCLPLRQTLSAITKGDEVTFNEQLTGRDGENVYVYTEEFKRPTPSFKVLDSDGEVVGSGTFESG